MYFYYKPCALSLAPYARVQKLLMHIPIRVI
jgi:hypothetical protein